MCGIAAIIFPAQEPAPTLIEQMTESLAHRGPDAKGIERLPGCHLGHRRLSIIDLGMGAQPMADVGGRYWIVFNGEIYNYRELRRELTELGVRFKTHSDTEVILAAYDAWGASGLDRLRGMFAFLIWDTRTRTAFAARDLFGEKPLYYATSGDGSLLVSSEIKGILASSVLTPQLDLNSVDAYLALGYVPPDRTIYSNVHTLPPGHYLEWGNGAAHVTRYWLPRLEPQRLSLEDAAEQLRMLMRQAVNRQMVADVPVGAFLSGGLDSSTIVALMQEQSNHPIQTFSVGFGDYINELPYARAVAKQYDTEHHEIDLGVPHVGEMLQRMAVVYDEPFADTSNIPTYLISEFARLHVKVVLSGDGGDELFGGYGWYPPLAKSEYVAGSWAKWAVFRLLSRMFRERIPSLHVYSVALGLSHRWPDMWMRGAMSNICFREKQRWRLWGERQRDVPPFSPGDYCRPPSGTAGLNRSLYFDLTSYLPGDILVKLDRAAMAHGLETRPPFLDRDLVEFALSLPATMKVNGNDTKVVLRRACECYWPQELHTRGKLGFGSPCDVWLNFPEVQEQLRRVFASGSRLREVLAGLPSKWHEARPYETWVLLVLGLWLEGHEALA